MENLQQKIKDLRQRLDRLEQRAVTVDDWTEVTRLQCKLLGLRSTRGLGRAA